MSLSGYPRYPEWIKLDRYPVWLSDLGDKELRIFCLEPIPRVSLSGLWQVIALYDHQGIIGEWFETEAETLARVEALKIEFADIIMEWIL